VFRPDLRPAYWTGDDRVSQVPGESSCVRAELSDPGGTGRARPIRRSGAAFRLTQGVGPRHIIDFGARSHGPHTRCLPEGPGAARRFAGRVAPPPRKIRFRLWATLCRAGLATRRTPQKVSAVCLTWHPPSPGFAWRTGYSVLRLGHTSTTEAPRRGERRTERESYHELLSVTSGAGTREWTVSPATKPSTYFRNHSDLRSSPASHAGRVKWGGPPACACSRTHADRGATGPPSFAEASYGGPPKRREGGPHPERVVMSHL
jgi:hypothetical protein